MILNRTPIYISNDHRLIVIFLLHICCLICTRLFQRIDKCIKNHCNTLKLRKNNLCFVFVRTWTHSIAYFDLKDVLWAKNWNVSSKLSACQCIQSLLRSWAASNSCLPLKSVRVVVNVITDKNRTSCLRW